MLDFLTFFIFFFFLVTVVYLLKRDTIQNSGATSSSIEQEELEDNNPEFETDDCDREVDEMPDDCLIYDALFDEE